MYSQNQRGLSREHSSRKIRDVKFTLLFERCGAGHSSVFQIDSATHQLSIHQGLTEILLCQIDLRMPCAEPDVVAIAVLDELEKRLIDCGQKDCLGLSKTILSVDSTRLASVFWTKQLIDITKRLLYEALSQQKIPRRMFAKHREVYLQAFPP